MTGTTIDCNEPILGYSLQKRIGDGGYGEVWTAVAPGGLMKAIKFIYGFHDEARAQRELKSLNHILELRHPFLLSLERIEVVNGRLVIVTELADKSLPDRFDECVSEGLPGIPRAELLNYMREAADGLDFMGQTHSLQHLDVKPENLLLVSGHVKVADFGLVKDIHDCTQSVMGGLTPAFAAPELFDGRPTNTSDQYSLAIVYQDMLTGERPFAGTTPAQLAAQHIHGRPNLRSLPRADQSVVLRALSKNPEHRYESCMQFVEALLSSDKQVSVKKKQVRGNTTGVKKERTVVLSDLPTSRSSERVGKLPPTDLSEAVTQIQPTLFLGVGGLGTRVVRNVKQRLHYRDGKLEKLPAFRFLGIDVDQDDLYAASRGALGSVLSDDQCFAMPLRRPEQYKADKQLDLSWISRRWIFNIPRSRKTEGIRPLGRLAFVDNCQEFRDRLSDSISPLLDENLLAATGTSLGLETNGRPRVYLVGAISGGVGSGCLIDVAFSVRATFAELGVDDIEIIGILAHGTGSGSSRSLSAANTYAFLRELHHFRKTGYPGDEACDLPDFTTDEPPFDSTYVVHLGDGPSEHGFQTQLDALAEYAYLDSTTANKAANDRFREVSVEDSQFVRTFGLADIDLATASSASRLQRLHIDQLLKRWISPTNRFDHVTAIDQLLTKLRLGADQVFDLVADEVAEATGLSPYHLASEVARSICQQQLVPGQMQHVAKEANESIRGWFQSVDQSSGFSVSDRLDRRIAKLSQDKMKPVQMLIEFLVNQPGARLYKAGLTIDELMRVMASFDVKYANELVAIEREFESIEDEWQTNDELVDKQLSEQVAAYCQLAARIELTQLTQRFLRYLKREAGSISKAIQEVTSTVSRLGEMFGREEQSEPTHGDGTFLSSCEETIVGELVSRSNRSVANLDDSLQKAYFDKNGGYWNSWTEEGQRQRQEFEVCLKEIVRNVIQDQIRALNLDDIIHATRISDNEFADWMRPRIELATPHILDCGGKARMLLSLAASTQGLQMESAATSLFELPPTVVRNRHSTSSVCFEVESVPVSNIALRLIEESPEVAECVGRLSSRNDIDWGPLTGIA